MNRLLGSLLIFTCVGCGENAQDSAQNIQQGLEQRTLVIATLGDSYASGEGNPDVEGNGAAQWTSIGEAGVDAAICHRSRFAGGDIAANAVLSDWPDQGDFVAYRNFACTGAKINDGLLSAQEDNRPMPCVPGDTWPTCGASQIQQLQDWVDGLDSEIYRPDVPVGQTLLPLPLLHGAARSPSRLARGHREVRRLVRRRLGGAATRPPRTPDRPRSAGLPAASGQLHRQSHLTTRGPLIGRKCHEKAPLARRWT